MKDKAISVTTDELWARLFSAPTVNQYLAENASCELPPLRDYLGELCRAKNEPPEKVINRAGIERSFGHHLFRGSRKPSRDTVLQLAIGLELSPVEAQQLLKVARMSPLHPKVKRDAVIAHCLYHGTGFVRTQQLLMEQELPLLGGVQHGK